MLSREQFKNRESEDNLLYKVFPNIDLKRRYSDYVTKESYLRNVLPKEVKKEPLTELEQLVKDRYSNILEGQKNKKKALDRNYNTVVTAIKVLDPTGISSWEDFAENRQEKGWTDLETYTSFIGSLPYLNKLTKGYKTFIEAPFRVGNLIDKGYDINDARKEYYE